ncbi:MAG: hypothetical protein MJZ81_01505 [Bacteroidales bacterium]|nr:hypothetical protein [Bacteroidales bacterium]
MATLHLSNSTTVEELRKEFNENFGSQVKLYKGRSVADESDPLSELGLTTEGTFECRSSLTVASFIERMMDEFGLKVKVYTCDEWVACLDGLTLESTGKVKKNASKADMEDMIAYQRSAAGEGSQESDGAAQQEQEKQQREADKARAEAELEKRKAEEARLKAEAEAEAAKKAKAEQEKLKAEAAAMAAAKEAAEKAKAELAKQRAEAEAAKAELAKLQAEAAKAKAEAETAKKAAAASAQPAPKPKCEGALSGLFSVAKEKQVRFSMGSLQFHPKKYEFRFAEHQYDRIEKKDIFPVHKFYDGWIDCFGFGTSGYLGCEPTENSTKSNDYPNIPQENHDWGVYNPIINGGNKAGLWRSLKEDEAKYLLERRPNADKLKAKATVNNVKGVVLLPDDFYEHRARVPFDATANYADNTYDIETWTKMEESGAIFLPNGHFRFDDARKEWVWTPMLRIWIWNNYCIYDGVVYSSTSPYLKSCVRLVQDVE